MDNNLIFVPVLVQVFLTLGLYVYLAIAKSRAVARGQVNEERRVLYEDAWPETVQRINNSIRNQFEIPVLFYVLVFIFWASNAVNIYIHVLAWLFILSRLVHAYIHTGSNYVPHRRKFFTIGWFLILIMAIVFLANQDVVAGEDGEPSIISLNPYWGSLKSISVTLNDREMDFLFDTGGGLAFITPEAATAIGCQAFGKIIVHRHNGDLVEAPRCAGAEIEIGTSHYNGEVGIFDLMALLEGLPELGGIISLREFDGQFLTLDIGHDRLIVETDKSFRARIKKMSEISIRPSRSASGKSLDIFVAVDAPGGPLWMELDSGNAAEVFLAPHAVAQLGLKLDQEVKKLTELNIIGFGTIETAVHAKKMIYDGLLNAAFLNSHTVTLDLKLMRGWVVENNNLKIKANDNQW